MHGIAFNIINWRMRSKFAAALANGPIFSLSGGTGARDVVANETDSDGFGFEEVVVKDLYFVMAFCLDAYVKFVHKVNQL